MDAVVLHWVGFLEYFCPKQGQDFKPSPAPIYPSMGQVPPLPSRGTAPNLDGLIFKMTFRYACVLQSVAIFSNKACFFLEKGVGLNLEGRPIFISFHCIFNIDSNNRYSPLLVTTMYTWPADVGKKRKILHKKQSSIRRLVYFNNVATVLVCFACPTWPPWCQEHVLFFAPSSTRSIFGKKSRISRDVRRDIRSGFNIDTDIHFVIALKSAKKSFIFVFCFFHVVNFSIFSLI